MAEQQTGTAIEIQPMPGDLRVERALLTVFDKRGVVDLARALTEMGVEIISTGGTAAELAEHGVETRSIEDYTGFPEILDGRVKTLHPSIFAGLLAVRSREEHRLTLAEHGIAPIDLVVVNLYPFERTAARRGVPDDEVIEHIDIGGPTLIRAAAKNHAHVGVIVRPESYDAVIEELSETGGSISAQTRESLATEAFGATARYDAAISRWFAEREDDFPNQYVAAFEKVLDLSYGENPHQRAAYYEQVGMRTHLLARTVKVHGKELSFNNLLDLDAGRKLVNDFEVPATAIIKHNNPCGAAIGETVLDAYERALASDPQSAYGGVVVMNREIDVPVAEKLAENFVELLFAPGYTHEALDTLRAKPGMRIIEDSERRKMMPGERDLRKVMGGVMLQDRDSDFQERGDMEVVTKRRPTEAEWGELMFVWKIVRHVRSNAIVIGNHLGTVGIGAGQMSRVDAVRFAVEKAQESQPEKLSGAALASDAFFPFADGPQLAIDVGVRAIIQPGGSKRDPEVIAACDAAGVAMVFTGRRHFRH
jgi:phosphoribosylaminoimidazolecarboxamide formyltransferase/IMP cyclohydrolase